MLFIANCKVEETQYEVDKPHIYREIQLVEAEDESEAYKKVEAFYDKKTDPYCVYYSVNIESLNEIIK